MSALTAPAQARRDPPLETTFAGENRPPPDGAVQREALARRTFAIISHPDAGKTTLTEKLLLYAGQVDVAGAVRGRKTQRAATSDWMALERERGISVTSTVLAFPFRGFQINLLDTPGHQDFSEDTYRTLTAADSHPLWARYFGRLHLGKIRGVLMTSNVAASSLGPLLIGLSRDAFGNYELILTAFMLLPVPVAACAVSARAPVRIRQSEHCSEQSVEAADDGNTADSRNRNND